MYLLPILLLCYQDDLRTYFEKFGTVVDSEVKTDHHTGHSRGFAFVTFEDPASVEAVCLNLRINPTKDFDKLSKF